MPDPKYIIENSNWAQRRMLYVFIIFSIIFLILGFYFYKKYQNSKIVAPSCSDSIMNQNEGGIDCEGACIKICREHMTEIKVLFTKAVQTNTNTYDLVSMIENSNRGKSPGLVNYIFKVYNKSGSLVATSTGRIYIDDAIKIPIIAPNISLPEQYNDLTTTLELDSYDMYPSVPYVESVKVAGYSFDNTKTKLIVDLINSTLENSNDIQVKALIANGSGDIMAVGQTSVSSVYSKEKKQAIITWPSPIPDNYNIIQIYIVPEHK